MGIFTRFRDIINANINAMLDRAEDPEKLVRLMIREMEDTLVEIKASCASVMAQQRKLERQLQEARSRESAWEDKARLAVAKDRDDLAREALIEKRRYGQKAEVLNRELAETSVLVDQYHQDIRQLEDKLASAKERQRLLVQRHIHAARKRQAQEDIRRMDNSDAVRKFEEFEQRIERMEAEADLVNFGRRPGLEEQLEALEADEEIEGQLASLKSGQPQEHQASPRG